MRPRIGITSWHHGDDEERWEAVLDAYTRAVLEVGGLPVILPIAIAEPALIEEYLETIDGLIMTGGVDIHPSFYGQIVLERCGGIDEERGRFGGGLVPSPPPVQWPPERMPRRHPDQLALFRSLVESARRPG